MIVTHFQDQANRHLWEAIDERFPVFFQKEYGDYCERAGRRKLVLLFWDGGNVCAPLLLQRVGPFKFARWLYPPVFGGDRLPALEEACYVEKAMAYLQQGGFDRIRCPPAHCLFQTVPDRTLNCRFGSYVLELQAISEDELFRKMHLDHRKQIRHARDASAQVKFGPEQLEKCLQLCWDTMERSAMNYIDRQDFLALHNYLTAREHILCGVAYWQDTPVSALLVPFTQPRAFYRFGGTALESSVLGANKLLHWEAIRWLRNRGVRTYDFVGARLSDVKGSKLDYMQRFKRRFGGTLQEGFLWKKDLRKARARLWDLLVAIRARLRRFHAAPGTDIIDEERRKQTIEPDNAKRNAH